VISVGFFHHMLQYPGNPAQIVLDATLLDLPVIGIHFVDIWSNVNNNNITAVIWSYFCLVDLPNKFRWNKL